MSYCKVDKDKVLKRAVSLHNETTSKIGLRLSEYDSYIKAEIKSMDEYESKSFWYRLFNSPITVMYMHDHGSPRFYNILNECNEIIALCALSDSTIILSKKDARLLSLDGDI